MLPPPLGNLADLGLNAAPQRVVSLVPSMTGSLFDLGLGQRVVGVTDYCVYQPDGVAGLLEGDALLLDARAEERYRGEIEPIDPRPGHVPGALSAPFSANLDAAGHFLAPEVLRRRYAALGAEDRPVVAYCGSGLTAAHDLLALELAGIEGGRLYEGSWSDWSSQPSRPAAVGDAP